MSNLPSIPNSPKTVFLVIWFHRFQVTFNHTQFSQFSILSPFFATFEPQNFFNPTLFNTVIFYPTDFYLVIFFTPDFPLGIPPLFLLLCSFCTFIPHPVPFWGLPFPLYRPARFPLFPPFFKLVQNSKFDIVFKCMGILPHGANLTLAYNIASESDISLTQLRGNFLVIVGIPSIYIYSVVLVPGYY